MTFVRLIIFVVLTFQLTANTTKLVTTKTSKSTLPKGWTDLVDNYSKFTKKVTLFGSHKIKDWTPAIKKAIKDGNRYIYFKPGTYHIKGNGGEPAAFGDSVWVGSGPWEWPHYHVQTSVIAYTEVNSNGAPLKKSILDGSIKTSSTIGLLVPTSFRAKYIGFQLKTYHKTGFSSKIPPQATVIRMQNTDATKIGINSSQNISVFKGCTFQGSGLIKKLESYNSDGGTDIYYEGNGGVFEDLNFASNGAGLTLALPNKTQQTSDFIVRDINFHAGNAEKIRITGSQQLRILVEGVISNVGGTLLNIVSGGLINSKISKNQVGSNSKPRWNKNSVALIDADQCKINNTIISYNSAHGYGGNRDHVKQDKHRKLKSQHQSPLHMIRFKKDSIIKGILIMANNLSFSRGDLIRFESEDAKEIFLHSNILTSPGFNARYSNKLNAEAVAFFMQRKQQSVSFYGNELDSYYFDQSGNKTPRERPFLTNLIRRYQNKNPSWVEVERFNNKSEQSESLIETQNASEWFTNNSRSTSIAAYSKLTTRVLLFDGTFITDWSPAINAAIKDGKKHIYFPAGIYNVTGRANGEPCFFGASGKSTLSWYGETDKTGTYKSSIIAHTKVKEDGSAWIVEKGRHLNGKPTKDKVSTQSSIGFWFTSPLNARYLQFKLKTFDVKGYLDSPPKQATVIRIQNLDQWQKPSGVHKNEENIHTYMKNIILNGSGRNTNISNENSDGGTDIYFEGNNAVFEGIKFTSQGSAITLALPQENVLHNALVKNEIVLRNLHFDNGDTDKIRLSGSALFSGLHINNFTATNQASKENSSAIRLLGGGFKDSVIANIHMGKKPLLINADGSDNCQIWRTIISDSSTNKTNLDDCIVAGMIPRYK